MTQTEKAKALIARVQEKMLRETTLEKIQAIITDIEANKNLDPGNAHALRGGLYVRVLKKIVQDYANPDIWLLAEAALKAEKIQIPWDL